MAKKIRIGGFSAFWGDTPTAAHQLVNKGGHLDYLIGDYLAEITMCILARYKAASIKGKSKGGGEGGYVAEFVTLFWRPLMAKIMEKKIKVVTNAGGMNPLALKNAIEEAARKAGVEVPKVAAVFGDDLTDIASKKQFQEFAIEGEKEKLWPTDTKLMSCNAYVGAVPIAEALAKGAQIVVTGRVVDSALVLGPLMYEFGWKVDDYDLLSSGSLCGHIIECGAQCTGGNFTDWRDSSAEGWDDVGFPIAECNADGSFIITKPEKTGGLVSFGTVAEQMLYEIMDPAAYILPDVICDWRNVTISEVKKNHVLVRGARGRPPTPTYKVAATYMQGFRTTAMMVVSGFEAAEKAQAVAEALLKKARRMFKNFGLGDFTKTNISLLGNEATYGPLAEAKTREVVMVVSVMHDNDKALKLFSLEMAGVATGMAPGLHEVVAARPSISPVIKYISCLIDKKQVPIQIKVENTTFESRPPFIPSQDITTSKPQETKQETAVFSAEEAKDLIRVPLIALCYGRSGDKGDSANIGLIARKPAFFPLVKQIMTAETVQNYLSHLLKGKVVRYELPGVSALNFVCTRALGGGGVTSLQMDRQGKNYAQKLLSYQVNVPKSWVSEGWKKTVNKQPRSKI